MAAHIVAWLRDAGWDVYEEISSIDIVAQRTDGFLWAIECKLAFGLDVMAQADARRSYVDAVSVGVPSEFRSRGQCFAQRCARRMGIGVVVVRSPTRHSADGLVRELVEPGSLTGDVRNHRRRKALETCLTPEAQAVGNHAGQATGSSWSPFKQTRHDLRAFVKLHSRPTLKEAVAGISHHYHDDARARKSLSQLFGTAAIPELHLVYDRERKQHVIEEDADAATP